MQSSNQKIRYQGWGNYNILICKESRNEVSMLQVKTSFINQKISTTCDKRLFKQLCEFYDTYKIII